MRHRNHQRNVSHTFAAYLFFGNFHAATVADNAFVTDPFILSAVAFIVFDRAKYAFAKEAAHFGLIGTVVDGFRFQHLAKRAVQNRLRRRQTNSDVPEIAFKFRFLFRKHSFLN